MNCFWHTLTFACNVIWQMTSIYVAKTVHDYITSIIMNDNQYCINCNLNITRLRRNCLSLQTKEVRQLIQQWISRRRSQFRTINVDSNNVADFPQLTFDDLVLIACWTYQIKQARCNYGEHRRANGMYQIEVCREIDFALLQDIAPSDNCWLLRGKIQSRHISQKTYFVYIVVDNSLSGREAIQHRYCVLLGVEQ